jgi:hypothetical protein
VQYASSGVFRKRHNSKKRKKEKKEKKKNKIEKK